MSFQAVTWAIEQRAGNPSAKSALWSIANYANEYWCAFPSQETIAGDSEQSVDSVGRRIADLIALGLLRRIKLKRYGRRSHDFFILRPSKLFDAAEAEIGPHLPAGCEIMADRVVLVGDKTDAAADCGSVEAENSGLVAGNFAPPSPDATAICGSVDPPETAPTLPQSAVHATALVREHESVTNQESPPIPPSLPEARPQPARQAGGPEPEPLGFAAFWSDYPDHATDNRRKAAIEFAALSETDRRKATEAANLYGRDIRKRDRKPVGAWKWLKERRFSEYTPGAGKNALGRVFVAEGGEAWQAWCAVGALAYGGGPKIATFWAGRGPHNERGALVPSAWPLGGEGWLVPLDRWVFVEQHTRWFNRWNERLHEICGQPLYATRFWSRPDRTMRAFGRGPDGALSEANPLGAYVPSEWPPAKGERRHGADPPHELSPEDADALINS